MKPPRRWDFVKTDDWEGDFKQTPKGNYVLYEDYVALAKLLEKVPYLIASGGYETVEQVVVVDKAREQVHANILKRAAKSKPASKTTPNARGWRKMSTAPLGTPIEVRFKTDGTSFSDRTVTATLDEHGLWIGKVYWARWTADGHDRLDDWRPLSK